MRRIAREENMPDEIIFLSMIESALDPNATSGAKAVGLWQFMQATAGDYNLKVNLYIDERRDPEKATRAAMRYLKWLFNEFGDWYHALAAYNSGPNGPVKRGIEQLGRDNNPSFGISEICFQEKPKIMYHFLLLHLSLGLIQQNMALTYQN